MMKKKHVAKNEWKRCQCTECYIPGVLSKKANFKREAGYYTICHLLKKKVEIQNKSVYTCIYMHIY